MTLPPSLIRSAPAPHVWTRRAALAALPLALASPLRAAGVFPSRPVRIVVPYSVGVGPDVVARSVAEQLTRRWQHTVWVDNKPGASGIVAFGEVRRTPADGHTIFLADAATLAVNGLVHETLPYDPQGDLEPLSLLFRATFVLWAGAHSRLHDVPQLIADARRLPASVSYASLGNAHATQLAIESFARAAGIQLLHIPFRDSSALLAAVAAGEVDFTAISFNSVADLSRQGRLKPLAVGASRRMAELPDVPTLAEAGGPPVEMHPWAALVAARGTPAPVLDQWRRDLTAVLQSSAVREPARRAGYEITPSSPQAVTERVKADIALYAPLVAEGRVKRF